MLEWFDLTDLAIRRHRRDITINILCTLANTMKLLRTKERLAPGQMSCGFEYI